MPENDNHPLHPRLEAAEVQLQAALDDVCEDVSVEATSTDELIRIEETLAIASETAKHAISLRKRIDRDMGNPPVS